MLPAAPSKLGAECAAGAAQCAPCFSGRTALSGAAFTSQAIHSQRHRLPQRSAPLLERGSGRRMSHVAAAAAGAGASAAPALTYTSFEGNSWRVEFQLSGVRVLVDPWLVDRLTFGSGLEFAFAGSKRVVRPETIDVDKLVAETDLILLTQSIDDHAHRPTLKMLPKSIPVVGSPSAAKVARELGYTDVTEVGHGQEVAVAGGALKVKGTAGALVGPPWTARENGFVLREAAPGGASLYYEPHCDFVPASVAAAGPVDVVVSPPSTQSLLGYELVKGATENVPLLRLLRPKVLIPLENADFDQQGLLADLLAERGGSAALAAELAAVPDLEGVRVQVPQPGQPMAVVL